MAKALVVDDSAVVRKVAKRILAGANLIVLEAANASEAMALCHENAFDFILVEKELDGMKVEQFIREICGDGKDRKKPVIMLGMVGMDVPGFLRAKRAGAKGFFFKPFNREHLLEQFETAKAA